MRISAQRRRMASPAGPGDSAPPLAHPGAGSRGDPPDLAASGRSYGPEQRLVAAVPMCALVDLAVTTGPDTKTASTAFAWIFGVDLGGSGWSFAAACELVGLDPEAVSAREISRQA